MPTDEDKAKEARELRQTQETLQKVFVRLFDDNENERLVAATVLANLLRTHGIHPTDVNLTWGRDLYQRMSDLIDYQAKRAEEHFLQLDTYRKRLAVLEKTIRNIRAELRRVPGADTQDYRLQSEIDRTR